MQSCGGLDSLNGALEAGLLNQSKFWGLSGFKHDIVALYHMDRLHPRSSWLEAR